MPTGRENCSVFFCSVDILLFDAFLSIFALYSSKTFPLTENIVTSPFPNFFLCVAFVMGSPSAASSSPNFKWSYDVFLSFRGEDTRSNFTSHLDMALRQKGVNVFIDDKLERGEQISESLFRSIEEALISIVVFSENYASSSWCLDELVKIIECKKSKGQRVWPIFYKVDPSDIRKQTGSFGEALAKHQPKFIMKIQTWRDALTAAANLSGWNLGTRKEADLIQVLVKEVLYVLNHICMPLYVAKYPVGIDSQLELLKHSQYGTQQLSDCVYMVGICGIGGIGKTTLAKALYNKIANQFEGSCFLSNVREASKKFNGLVQLQENLLYEILKYALKVGNLDKGINIIRNRLCSKKVLIVLDDVDKLDQLEKLVGGRDWFGRGSKIIVTTRNKHLLSCHGFDQIHDIQGLDQDKALELFSWHAFKESHPSSNYLDFSKRATSYCKGHPLALAVLGSFLCGRGRSNWESILDEFENSLSKDIKDILQISFDGLEDNVKDIFLDISCLFVGEKVDNVKKMLNTCHLNPDFGIIVLMDLSLMMVENGIVQMHDLIRQMGHKIVYGESSEPGKRSRLWLEKDILEVFIENLGTDTVKAIKLDLPKPTRLDIDAQAFRNMKNLRLLIVRNARFSTKLEYLPNSLNWIEWPGFAQSSLPRDFIMKNLVVLDLQHSFIRSLGKGFKDCERLKRVDLSNSTLLEKIPDFSAASNLGELNLSNCTNLRMIHESIGSLDKLVTLKLRQCTNLKKLPSYLKLKSLNSLDLSSCRKLEKFPKISENMNSLKVLNLDFTAIKELPSSIGNLSELRLLNLNGCTNLISLPSTIYLLKNLEELRLRGCCRLEKFPYKWEPARANKPPYSSSSSKIMKTSWSLAFSMHLLAPKQSLCSKFTLLDLQHCNISNVDFLEILCNVAPFLSDLRLSENKFSSLPACLHKFVSLWNLESRNCKFLREIPNLPHNIQNLDASGCKSLARSPDNIVDIISEKQDFTLGDIQREFLLTGSEIPQWFSYQTRTNLMSASFRHYPDRERTLAACVIFKVKGDSYNRGTQISCNIFICNTLHCSFTRQFLPSKSEYMWLVTASLARSSMEVKGWNNVLVWFEVQEHNEAIVTTVRSYGIHVTEEHQMDVKWPVVNYSDFYQLEKLPNLDIEASVVRDFVQAISAKLNCNAMLHVGNYDPDHRIDDSKIQAMIFPLHATWNGFTVITGMEGMGETALAKSLCNKFGFTRSGSHWEEALNNPTSFFKMRGRALHSYSHIGKYGDYRERRINNITSDTLSSRKYLIIFENVDYKDISDWVRQRWFRPCSGSYSERTYHLIIDSVDIYLDAIGGVDMSPST